MIDRKLAKSFNNMLWRLDCHPALPSTVFSIQNSIWYSLQEVCKNGYSDYTKHDGIDIWYSPVNYKKYKKLFDKELKEDPDQEKRFLKIKVPYKDVYGYEWEFDHCEYWGEMSFYVFRGNDFTKDWHNRENWDPCGGPQCSANSYEELIIKIGKLFLRDYINKTDEDFLTAREKANHEKHWAFVTDRVTKDGKGHYLDRNPKYIQVTEAELNRRWLREYAKTEHYQKHWKSSFEGILTNEISKTKKS